MADGTTAPRGARLVGMDEVCTLLDVERRTVERWITAKTFPAPARIGENKVAFPLADLQAWARKRGDSFASEVERLAHTRAADMRPEALEKQIAKRLTRATGTKIAADKVVMGHMRPMIDADVAAMSANFANLSAGIGQDMNERTSLVVAALMFPALRPMFSGLSGGAGAKIFGDERVLDQLAAELLAEHMTRKA